MGEQVWVGDQAGPLRAAVAALSALAPGLLFHRAS